jgi:hypothetical protein
LVASSIVVLACGILAIVLPGYVFAIGIAALLGWLMLAAAGSHLFIAAIYGVAQLIFW